MGLESGLATLLMLLFVSIGAYYGWKHGKERYKSGKGFITGDELRKLGIGLGLIGLFVVVSLFFIFLI